MEKDRWPIYYQHPATGVVIEIDVGGLTTFFGEHHGQFRPYSEMSLLGFTAWTAADEIAVLRKAGWVQVSNTTGEKEFAC
jgi:hypothetical protein